MAPVTVGIHYWGDIDTHGFDILASYAANRLEQILSGTPYTAQESCHETI
ncbi:Wadjet anti-phage system protein JetD domain-containing protein [Thermithiobacillus plumbiphilus]